MCNLRRLAYRAYVAEVALRAGVVKKSSNSAWVGFKAHLPGEGARAILG